jgi:hypothetical protein
LKERSHLHREYQGSPSDIEGIRAGKPLQKTLAKAADGGYMNGRC